MPDRPQSSAPTPTPQGDDNRDDNPFAAPPEGRPDQPWQPRHGADGHQRREEGPGGGPGTGMGGGPARWDPTDPVQRRARYALLAGMWGFFFGLFGIPSMGLLLGALAVYWGVSALRGKPKAPDAAGTAPGGAHPGATPGSLPAAYARPQRTAAVGGLIAASLALLLAVSSYTLQLVYKDFYVCRDDALTHSAELKCNSELPKPLRNLIGVSP
ncbi:hypothetical protein [Streptomyces sp. NPDC089799]|uniref:hypothetical protein n=1 Tax=Streptomyces sp. NPDC089799 TaxID=3155066 RepID=UPI00341F8C7E